MQLGERTLIMGVLNITPDSFSDGGRFNDPDRAYARALELEEQGADIIDIGAESTKPGSHRITADEEWQRLVPVLKRFRGNLRAPLSLDTYKSEIAERALQYGVEIFNDPSGLTFDPNLAKVAASGNAGLILNHMRGQPETWAKLPPMQDPLGTIARELDATASRARHAGVERGRIVIDPGLGFGKRKEQNAEILAHLQQLAGMDYPILVGPSRKSFLAQASESGALYATAAAVTAAVLNGAHIVRVHDVKEMQVVVQVAEEIARAAAPKPAPNVEERMVVRAHTRTGPNFEAERPRPPRPPLARPPIATPPIEEPILPVAAIPESLPEIEGESQVENQAEAPVENPVEKPPVKEHRPAAPRVFARPRDAERDNRRDSRPPRPSYQNRDQRDGSRPPVSRPFTPRRPADQSGSAPPRGRDFRPGQGTGPKRPYEDRPPRRDDGARPPRPRDREEFRPAARSGPPRTGPPRPRSDDDRSRPSGFKPSGFKPKGFKPAGPPRSFDRPPRSFDRGDDSRQGRPERGFSPPRGGPPRSGPPRSGPPRGDRPGSSGPSGPPKRPFRKRP
jgi:dihydropteroate synthase